jgi:hypothetical protein
VQLRRGAGQASAGRRSSRRLELLAQSVEPVARPEAEVIICYSESAPDALGPEPALVDLPGEKPRVDTGAPADLAQ